MRLKNRALLASALGWLLADAAGCANAQQMCAEPAKQTQSPLARAPRNGAQYGGMTIDPGGVSEGAGAPKAAADSGHGVIRIYVILSAPGAGLSVTQRSALAGTLGEIRSTGVLQALLRFYYQSPLTSKANAADSVNKIKADIASAKPTVAEYVDVIPFIQAGFLGPWGEWWGGDLEGGDFGTDQDLRVLKTGTVNALKPPTPLAKCIERLLARAPGHRPAIPAKKRLRATPAAAAAPAMAAPATTAERPPASPDRHKAARTAARPAPVAVPQALRKIRRRTPPSAEGPPAAAPVQA